MEDLLTHLFVHTLLSVWFNLLASSCMQMTILSMFSPFLISLELQPDFQLIFSSLVCIYTLMSTDFANLLCPEVSFISLLPTHFLFFCYVNKNITQLSFKLKYVTCSFVSILIWYSIMGHVKSVLSWQHFSIKLCPPILICVLWFSPSARLLDYRNSFAIDITIFSLCTSKSD